MRSRSECLSTKEFKNNLLLFLKSFKKLRKIAILPHIVIKNKHIPHYLKRTAYSNSRKPKTINSIHETAKHKFITTKVYNIVEFTSLHSTVYGVLIGQYVSPLNLTYDLINEVLGNVNYDVPDDAEQMDLTCLH